MFPFFKHQEQLPPTPKTQELDKIFSDLPRGEEGRKHSENNQQHAYFESVQVLSENLFQDTAGHNFVGVINGATELVERDDGRKEFQTKSGTPIGILDDRHMTTIAGSRSGKGRSIIIPQLLSYSGSVIVNDVKGENTAITSRFRAEDLGQSVHVIDPFCITPARCAKYRKSFNPVRILNPENLNSVADAALIADGIVAAVSEHEPHWDESSKMLIETLLLHVATGPFSAEQRNLNTVYDLLSGKIMSTENLIEELLENPTLNGRIVAGGRNLQEMSPKERGSILSTARRHMHFMTFDGIQNIFSGHDFELNELKTKKTTIYLVLPATRMHSCKGLLRLFANLTLGMVEVETTRPKYPVLAILDELPVLGYMSQLESAIGQVAGLGLRIHSVLQDLGQLKALYGDRYETFLANSGCINVFGTTDAFTSEWVSRYLGQTTISVQERHPVSLDQKSNGETGISYRTHNLDLLSPSEVRRYTARDDHYNRMLTLIPGKRPWLLQRVDYDNHELFKGRFEKWR